MLHKIFNSVVGKVSGAFVGAVAAGAAMSVAGDILSLLDRVIPGSPMAAGGIAAGFAMVAAYSALRAALNGPGTPGDARGADAQGTGRPVHPRPRFVHRHHISDSYYGTGAAFHRMNLAHHNHHL